MRPRLAVLLLAVLALLAMGVLLWRRSEPGGARATPNTGSARGNAAVLSAATDWYEIYFTEPRYPDRPEYHRGGIDERLVALIDSAERTLEMAIYDFDLENVALAMARAKVRGVNVRLVTDTDTLQNKNAEIQRAFQKVRDAGIPIVDDQRRAIMHHKFAVLDGEIVLTGSWNFTVGDTYRLNNNAVRLHSRDLATNYSAEFEKMFTQRKFGPTKPKGVPHPRITVGDARLENYFAAEDDPSARIVELLSAAQSTIDFMAFSFTHEAIGQVVIDRAKAGIKVRGVFETTGSETRFSEYRKMKAAGLEVYQDGNPYVMHHKVLVIDGRTTIFGSFNFSDNAANDNDENVIIVEDAAFARAFLGEVDRVVKSAKNRPPPRPAR